MMTRHVLLPGLCASLLALAATAACDGGRGPGDGDGEQSPVSVDDVFDIDALLVEDDDPTAGAITIGDPASLLAQGRQKARETIGQIRSVLRRIKGAIENRDPDISGETEDGRPYGVWARTVDGVDMRLLAIRQAEGRVRYLVLGKPEGADRSDFVRLMTGVFLQGDEDSPRRGGGRLHINLGHISELTGGDVATGSLHVLFATGQEGAIGRRVFYRNMTRHDDVEGTPARNHGFDFIHKPGVGGRIRAIAIGDLIERDGIELLGLRVRWAHGVGGRADAVLARVSPRPVEVLRRAHECFDADGLRAAYADDDATNDDVDGIDEGDVDAPSACGGFERDDIDLALDENGHDADPELDDMLDASGANDIDEDDAENVDDIDA